MAIFNSYVCLPEGNTWFTKKANIHPQETYDICDRLGPITTLQLKRLYEGGDPMGKLSIIHS